MSCSLCVDENSGSCLYIFAETISSKYNQLPHINAIVISFLLNLVL